MNLHQKLIEVRKVVPYLQKENAGSQYKYVSSSQVLANVRAKMDELNILLVPKVTGHNVLTETIEFVEIYNGKEKPKKTTTYFTELDMIFTWVNADKPDETIECPWYGQGVDIAGEKGVGKAMTYAEKYFILKFLNIATDKDDPDSFQKRHDDDKGADKPRGNTNGSTTKTKSTQGQQKAPESMGGVEYNGADLEHCANCKEKLLPAVKVYCQNNKKIFQGLNYCKKCQDEIKEQQIPA
ncbi:MAG: ERF family protein [Thermincolia bacterium]